MANILNKIEKDERFDDVEESIIENCLTYEDYGELLVELLSFFAGSGDYEQRVTDLLVEMTLDHMCEVM